MVRRGGVWCGVDSAYGVVVMWQDGIRNDEKKKFLFCR